MHRTRLVTTLLVGALLGGCARGATMSEGGDVDLPPDDAALSVNNQNEADVDVYAVSGGVSSRLGTVIAHSTDTFRLVPSWYVGGEVRIVARAIGGGGLANSGRVTVRGGELIAFTVAPVLAQSTVLIR